MYINEVMLHKMDWEYQYFLKDHLGNNRVVFSERTTASEYKATFETGTQAAEQAAFENYGNRSNFNLFDHTDAGTTAVTYTYSQLLNGGNNSQAGLAKSFEVQAGDVFDLEVYAKYEAPTTTGNNVDALASSLIAAFGLNTTSPNPLDGQQAYNAFNSTFSAGPYIGRVPPYEDGSAPKAYLNYILFGENFALLDFGFDQISTTAQQVGATPFVAHDYLSLHVKVQKKGYLYIYLSNEQAVITNVYFDDLKITYHGGVEQVNDYFPFGLTFNSHARENSVANPYKFNDKEEQTELSFGLLDFEARQYDPAVGRFLSIDPFSNLVDSWSPYHFTYDNPIKFTDPSGMIAESVNYDLTSTFIKPDGTIIEHRDDNDPTIYLVTDEDAWIKRGRTKDGLHAVGIENPDHEYIPGEKIMLANHDHNLSGYATGRADPDYTIESFAIPLFGWLKWLRWGKFGFSIPAKIAKQLAKRGWTDDLIQKVINKAHTTRKATNRATGNPATAYFTKDGAYVVVDDVTKEIVQVSNRIDIKNWIPDGTIIDPYIPK
jgi:RHS repeat-associated protein